MDDWRLIETVPECAPLHGVPAPKVLLYGTQTGVEVGTAGQMHGYVFASIPTLHGNAVESWGVTHWMPLPLEPAPA